MAACHRDAIARRFEQAEVVQLIAEYRHLGRIAADMPAPHSQPLRFVRFRMAEIQKPRVKVNVLHRVNMNPAAEHPLGLPLEGLELFARADIRQLHRAPVKARGKPRRLAEARIVRPARAERRLAGTRQPLVIDAFGARCVEQENERRQSEPSAEVEQRVDRAGVEESAVDRLASVRVVQQRPVVQQDRAVPRRSRDDRPRAMPAARRRGADDRPLADGRPERVERRLRELRVRTQQRPVEIGDDIAMHRRPPACRRSGPPVRKGPRKPPRVCVEL